MALSVVCWKWENNPNLYSSSKKRRPFTAFHVNALLWMLKRRLRIPFELTCVTDNDEGIDPEVQIVPLWKQWREHGGCFTRLCAFKKDIGELFGPRFVSIDLDCVLVDDITPLFDRDDDFIIWGEHTRPNPYCGSMWMMNAGCRPQVYATFNADDYPPNHNGRRPLGTDQQHIARVLYPNEAMWGRTDGVVALRTCRESRPRWSLPPGTRIVFFNGKYQPDDPGMKQIQWVRDNYPLDNQIPGLDENPAFTFNDEILAVGDVDSAASATPLAEPVPDISPALSPTVTVACYWWGGWPNGGNDPALGPEYVKRLARSVARHMPKDTPYRFVCFTDNLTDDFGEGIEPILLPAEVQRYRWNLVKMWAYSEEVALSGRVLILDLDCVITGSLSPLIEYEPKEGEQLRTCEAAYRPGHAGGSVIGFDAPSKKLCSKLWEPLLNARKRATIEQETGGSERMYFRQQLKTKTGAMRFWEREQPGVIASYKRDCQGKGAYPKGTAIVRFHGQPRPHEVNDQWVKEEWRS